MSNRLTIVGSIVFATGMLVVGLALAVGGFGATAFAGNVSCVPTATPTATQPAGTINGLQAVPTCTPTASATTRAKTHTPTNTATAAPSSTSVPVTPAPTSTRAAVPTATQPGGGAAGSGIQPPNTGTGAGANGRYSIWLLIGGIALAVAGGGAVLTGVRRRL